MNNVRDLLALDHLERRGYWSHERDPWTGTEVRRPGAPYVIDGRRRTRAAAVPGLDEAGPDVRAGSRRARRGTHRPAADPFPLTGLKVADFSWIGVGPITARCLADHGATVVRVESEHRLDTTRAQAPFKDGEFGINRSNFYGSFNTSKRSVTLNLACPEGRAIARRLAEWADVVIDAFRPGTMDRLGLGDEQIRAANPGRSRSRPRSSAGADRCPTWPATASTPAPSPGSPTSWAGPTATPTGRGWRTPTPSGRASWSPPSSPPSTAATGPAQGCHIEGGQLEIGLQYLAPELLDHQLTGRMPTRIGNRDLHLAPQGAYRCAGRTSGARSA